MLDQTELQALDAELPPNVLLGTSSWNYEGWKGIVYHAEYKSEKSFRENSLAEYAKHPLFRTVGIDSSFYSPLRDTTLERYASQVPTKFRWVAKVWEEITVPHYGKHPRYGAKAGRANPHFLHADLFIDRVLTPLDIDGIREHVGPLVFQFQALPHVETQEPLAFIEKLSLFLSQLPPDFQYAFEIRNVEILQRPEYIKTLNEFGATHCFNHWTNMPPLIDQMKLVAQAGGLTSAFYVARLLTPQHVSYEDAVKLHAPYKEIRTPNEQVRADAARLALRAIERQVPAFIIVNNRLEGHAPGTILEIAKIIRSQLQAKGQSL